MGCPGRTGCLAKVGDGGLCCPVPVRVEVAACGVEEGYAGQVARRLERGVEGIGQGVDGKEAQGPAHDERWSVRVAVHKLSQRRADPLGGMDGAPVVPRGRGQPVQVRAGVRVEAQRAAERVGHLG
ncbi:hypothetical protein San01_13120 [Streptomyces angustmyceticus]|uniref:Uncharacterized protein n=1 Tax=Streptomyces angustmyceticus TaxID=285578 RepID=A0A5J4LF76_9ACTN|nr:hypothetical protein San01_13120 [Streptomyces angustmyceticus]